jgi:hypothetical protein
LSLSSQKYGFGIRDLRSGIRKKPIPDPGSRGQIGTGSRIRNTAKNTRFFLTYGTFFLLKIRYRGTVRCCGSGMFISDAGSEFFHAESRITTIPDPGSASKN